MKNEKGITMVTLITTIVIMLILASVTIHIVTDGGLIDKAEEATSNYQLHIFEDELKTYHTRKEMKKMQDDYNPKGLYADYDRIVYVDENNSVEVDETKNIYDILESLKGSSNDGEIWIKEGEIVFESPEDEIADLINN